MPLLKNSQTPDSCAIAGAEILTLSAGASVPSERRDAAAYLVVISGRVKFEEAGEIVEGAPGSILFAAPGSLHGVREVVEDATVAVLRGDVAVPYRAGALENGAEALDLPPHKKLKRLTRTGVTIDLDADRTFSPSMMGALDGDGILIETDTAQTPQNLLAEIRKFCFETACNVAGVILPASSADEMLSFIRDAESCGKVFMLYPAVAGIDADLTTEAGRSLARLMRQYWWQRFALNNIVPCVRMTYREWNEAELLSLFRELVRLPPARFQMVLHIESYFAIEQRRLRQVLRDLLPWLTIVEYADREDRQPLERVLDSLGFQGWILHKSA